ncbi:hypothetical protein ABW19_dt0201159 [Dactylella cylindrospora]|nr:hypothetical protein ABW19_dt0201159 [Dactylella cylindrospora]
MDVIQSQNVREICSNPTSRIKMLLQNPRASKVKSESGEFQCDLPRGAQSVPQKRTPDYLDAPFSSPKRLCNEISKPLSPQESFLNLSDEDDGGHDSSEDETNSTTPSTPTPPKLGQTPNESIQYGAFLDLCNDPQEDAPTMTPTRPLYDPENIDIPEPSNPQFTSPTSHPHLVVPPRHDEHAALDELLATYMKNADIIKREAGAIRKALEVELNCDVRASHIKGKMCRCGANTPMSVIHQYKRRQSELRLPPIPPQEPQDSETRGEMATNGRNPVIRIHEDIPLSHIPREESTERVNRRRSSAASDNTDSPRTATGRDVKLSEKEETLLRQAIRELALPVDELAVLVLKRYRNLDQGRLLRPIPPHVIEGMIRNYGYGKGD